MSDGPGSPRALLAGLGSLLDRGERSRRMPPGRKPTQPSTVSGASRFPARSSRTAQTLFAALLYFALACKVSWPIAIHPGTRIFGTIGADLTGEMAYFHSLAVAHTPPFLPGIVHVFNAPEGRATQWALNFSTLPSSTLLWLGSMAFGSVATLGYWAIFTFTLSALSMFLLVRWLTGNWYAALVCGFAFGFWPFVFTGMNQPLGDEWPIVLAVWRMLVAIERPSLRNGLLAGAAVAFALMWVQYFILIVGIAWVALALLALVVGAARGQFAKSLRAQSVAAVPIALVLTAIALAGLVSNFAGEPVRPASDLTTYSARPLMYLLPDPNNPFLGKVTKPILERNYFSAHSTAVYGPIYLGISVMLLGAAGLALMVRAVRRNGWRSVLADRALLAGALLAVVAVCALAFSAPPRIIVLGVSVPMPIEIVAHITPVFRNTARLAVIVMLGVCVLAGFALSKLFSRLHWRLALPLCAVLSLIVVGDLWARPPYPITRVSPPSVIRLLARQPPGIYAEYPFLAGSEFGGDSQEAFYQGYAGNHDLFDGYFTETTSESRKMELQYLLATRTLPDLAAMGVKYILVHRFAQPPSPTYPRFAAPIPGAQLIGADTFGALYRVVARPRAITGFDTVGFSLPEGQGGPRFLRWLDAPTGDGRIEIITRKRTPVSLRVSFSAASFVKPRRLSIRDEGNSVFNGMVSPQGVTVTFTLRVRRGHTLLYLHASPGPVSPHAVNPSNPDTRTLAIQVSGPLDLTPIAHGGRAGQR